MNSRRIVTAATFLAGAMGIAFAACSQAQNEPSPQAAKVKPGDTAPAFTLTDQSGKSVSLSDFKDKILVMEWINPDCPFSKRHTNRATLNNLVKKYAEKDVAFLAINSTHYFTVAKNKAWHTKHAYNHPILDDHDGKVGRAYVAKTTPDIRIIDAKGTLAYSGAIDDDPRGRAKDPNSYIVKALDELLAGKKVSTPSTTPYGCSVKYAKKAD